MGERTHFEVFDADGAAEKPEHRGIELFLELFEFGRYFSESLLPGNPFEFSVHLFQRVLKPVRVVEMLDHRLAL